MLMTIGGKGGQFSISPLMRDPKGPSISSGVEGVGWEKGFLNVGVGYVSKELIERVLSSRGVRVVEER